MFNKISNDGIGMTSLRTRLRLIDSLRQQGICNETVLNVMSEVPRHVFIDEAIESRAYENIPLPIGFGQTISQPYTVARMTQALLGSDSNMKFDSVLEIGTGSGYQSAVLSKLFRNVYTIERIKDLLNLAKKKFDQLQLRNIRTLYGDGFYGWQDHAPFDAIIVTCAVKQVPPSLLTQLKNNGRLVIPVNIIAREDTQRLEIMAKLNNEYSTNYLELVRFVPLLSGKI